MSYAISTQLPSTPHTPHPDLPPAPQTPPAHPVPKLPHHIPLYPLAQDHIGNHNQLLPRFNAASKRGRDEDDEQPPRHEQPTFDPLTEGPSPSLQPMGSNATDEPPRMIFNKYGGWATPTSTVPTNLLNQLNNLPASLAASLPVLSGSEYPHTTEPYIRRAWLYFHTPPHDDSLIFAYDIPPISWFSPTPFEYQTPFSNPSSSQWKDGIFVHNSGVVSLDNSNSVVAFGLHFPPDMDLHTANSQVYQELTDLGASNSIKVHVLASYASPTVPSTIAIISFDNTDLEGFTWPLLSQQLLWIRPTLRADGSSCLGLPFIVPHPGQSQVRRDDQKSTSTRIQVHSPDLCGMSSAQRCASLYRTLWTIYRVAMATNNHPIITLLNTLNFDPVVVGSGYLLNTAGTAVLDNINTTYSNLYLADPAAITLFWPTSQGSQPKCTSQKTLLTEPP